MFALKTPPSAYMKRLPGKLIATHKCNSFGVHIKFIA